MSHFNTITIIGVGLIGGSFARVCKKKNLADQIIGHGRGEANLKKAKELNVIDSYSLDLEEAVSKADLILIATPVTTISKIVKQALPFLKPGVIITDAGSVKGQIIKEIESILSDSDNVHFVPAHPIAGTEDSGVEASFPELFEKAKCIITPTNKTNKEALEKMVKIWKEMGSIPIIMDAEKHDHIFASVSHLPHIIAYTLVNIIGEAATDCSEIKEFAAGGFKDITRIASSDPVMWRDICMYNKKNMIQFIDSFQSALQQIKSSIETDDSELLERDFAKAKKVRNEI